ncbi:MAG TPA: hypothetical protein PKG60_11260 [Spirochaetota bacterium]|nr:hypothetical protein [Spirochaetota bacterium]HPS86237.1 hypothetical protein [Spirochaetota bacterium]
MPFISFYGPGVTIINTKDKINRCRPGFGASCSFCCGSHNYTISPDNIEEMFISRDADAARRLQKHPEDSFHEKLVKEGMQCAHVGISGSDPGLVGCLTYHDDHRGSGFESFFTGTCKHFLCVAWNELTDRQVLFAAELMKDWYYYSLLVNSLEILMDLCAEYESPEDVPDEVLSELKIELKEKLMEDDLI